MSQRLMSVRAPRVRGLRGDRRLREDDRVIARSRGPPSPGRACRPHRGADVGMAPGARAEGLHGGRLEGVVEDPIGYLRRTSESWLLAPDLTILIRVTAELGMTRIRDRPHRVRFEDLAFLRKVAANYDILARGEGHVVLDGGRPMDEVV